MTTIRLRRASIRYMKKLIFAAIIALFVSAIAFGQPRPVERTDKTTAKAPPAPESFAAKYEGGMLGYRDKETGTLKFDDANDRLVFFGKLQKESFSIPYDALLVIYPQSKSVTSTAGNVIRHIPLPGAALAGFIKEKRSYLVIQYDDPNIDVQGVLSFKLENKELLDSVIQTLADKAKMIQRGDAFYRPKAKKPVDTN